MTAYFKSNRNARFRDTDVNGRSRWLAVFPEEIGNIEKILKYKYIY